MVLKTFIIYQIVIITDRNKNFLFKRYLYIFTFNCSPRDRFPGYRSVRSDVSVPSYAGHLAIRNTVPIQFNETVKLPDIDREIFLITITASGTLIHSISRNASQTETHYG